MKTEQIYAIAIAIKPRSELPAAPRYTDFGGVAHRLVILTTGDYEKDRQRLLEMANSALLTLYPDTLTTQH